MRVRYADAAPVLHEQGWGTPVPSDPASKRPLLSNWSYYGRHRASEKQIALWASRWPEANTAIAVNADIAVAYLDIDFDEPAAAMTARAAAAEHLGHTPLIRVGREPRQVRMYRLAGAVEDLTAPGLELKTTAGLITLYGIHAGTGRPYFWPDEHPMETEPGDLPAITPGMVSAFMEVIAPFVVPRGRGAGIAPFDVQPAAPLLTTIADNPDVAPMEILTSVMRGAVEGCRRSTMFGAVVAAVMTGHSDEEVTDAILPVYLALHPQREQRACRQAFQDALRWIRRRHGADRYAIREQLAHMPWAGMGRG